tara:strand:- start:15240 stop:15464 length:225 start_codon:yes stop_codon:yes gene_type:complete
MINAKSFGSVHSWVNAVATANIEPSTRIGWGSVHKKSRHLRGVGVVVAEFVVAAASGWLAVSVAFSSFQCLLSH